MTKRTRKNMIKGLLFISPWLIGFAIFTIYPIFASLYYSFTKYGGIGTPQWIGLANYASFLKDELFQTSVYNTAFYAVFAVPLGLVAAMIAALALNQKVKGLSVFRAIIYIPAMVPAFASSFIWLWMLHPQFGIVNSLLNVLGINGPGWVFDPTWSKPSLIIMSQWGVGTWAIILLASLQDVPQQLYEAAELDGANWWVKFRSITFPSVSPIIFFQLILGINQAIQIFTPAYIMTKGGPANTTLFYSLHLYRCAFWYGKMGFASAMAWALLIVSALIILIVFTTSKRWVFYRGE